ncbi:uncharacterized protein LOC123514331 isoform X2 [Portunus trituberculatus]|uniref:uncharacterized protein LOC123514331 isoform X2 n=1 Tax=Portunus trituberculatus TaxID=210409 RepID=UPI001E1D0508|nr:uncharacterized protein LOC123514331 isoform X2 [Portunus trituberculatus]
MKTSLGCLHAALALVLVLALLQPAEGDCGRSDQIKCRTGNQCIYTSYICNKQSECPDGSDEDPKMCKFWPTKSQECRYESSSYIYHNGNCRTVDYMCQNSDRATNIYHQVCKVILRPKLEFEDEGMSTSGELLALLNSAVNHTLNQKLPDCPMLYSRVGNECLSFFSPARVSWAEARQFCLSIYGDLWQAKDLAAYGRLMEYMREEKLTANYWIGGRYDIDTNAWSWTTDDSTMPLGVPFWAIRYVDSCVQRGPPHTDPYSAPPAALPGARCYRAVLSPQQRSPGWCSAMTYEHFYYWTDEMCDEAYSPLCTFTGPVAAPIVADAH